MESKVVQIKPSISKFEHRKEKKPGVPAIVAKLTNHKRQHISLDMRSMIWNKCVGLERCWTFCVCGYITFPDTYQVAHITSFKQGGSYDESNLTVLCYKCNINMSDANYNAKNDGWITSMIKFANENGVQTDNDTWKPLIRTPCPWLNMLQYEQLQTAHFKFNKNLESQFQIRVPDEVKKFIPTVGTEYLAPKIFDRDYEILRNKFIACRYFNVKFQSTMLSADFWKIFATSNSEHKIMLIKLYCARNLKTSKATNIVQLVKMSADKTVADFCKLHDLKNVLDN